MEKPTVMTKTELARLCSVSKNTIGYWCNDLYYADLVNFGYRKTQKVFTPKQWHFLLDILIVIGD